MELKYILPSVISFFLAVIAFIPLAKYRLKNTEEENIRQGIKLEKGQEKLHELEVLILRKESESSNKSMNKMADALLLVAESNSKFQSIVETQAVLIQRSNETSIRAHDRLDCHIKDVAKEIDHIKEKFVSHQHLEAILGKKL